MFSFPRPEKDASISLPLKQTATCSKAYYQKLATFTFLLDTVVIAVAMVFSYWIRFRTSLVEFGVQDDTFLTLRDYSGHFIIGTSLMVLFLANFHFYSRRNLLSYTNALRVIFKASILWIFSYVTLALVLKFDPPISRVFCAIGLTSILVLLPAWRAMVWRYIQSDKVSGNLRQRAMVVGWSSEFAKAIDTFGMASERHFDIVGVIAPPGGKFTEKVPDNMPVMGTYESLELLLQMGTAQVVIVADDALKTGTLMQIASLCEKEMVEFKLVPTCFQVLLSGLHLESVGGIPVLGISKLPLHNVVNQYLKRALDILGALVGLILSAPLIGIFGLLIYTESKGSIFYRQRRLGANGQIFEMIKLRSMKLNAEAGNKVGWTVKDDPRCLRVGKLMRRLNIDEIPQFWNVLIGEMSLVGPRPERPELIEVFKEEIPHYNARHNIKPGITGWAQVNGLRGDTDLTERVRFDLHYIENWNVIFDFQIMLLTFFRREGAC